MGPKSRSKSTKASTKASTKEPTKEPTKGPPLRLTLKRSRTRAIEEVDLTQDSTPTAAAAAAAVAPPLKPIPYLLYRSVVITNGEGEGGEEKVVDSKIRLVKPGSFDYAKWNSTALNLVVGAYEFISSSVNYTIHRCGPSGKVEVENSAADPEEFASAEEILVSMAQASKSPWCLKLCMKCSVVFEEVDEDDPSESSSEEDEEVVPEVENKALAGSKEKSTKRKRATTTARMEQEVEERLQSELRDNSPFWGTRIAQAHPCRLKEKCPSRGGICIDFEGKHLTVFPMVVKQWEKACVEGRADESKPPQELMDKMLEAHRIDEDSSSSKRLRAKYDSGPPSTPAAPAAQPIVIQAPPAAAPAPAQLGMQDIIQAVLLRQLTEGQQQHRLPQQNQFLYNPYQLYAPPSMGLPPWMMAMHHQLPPQNQPQAAINTAQQPAPKIYTDVAAIDSPSKSTLDPSSSIPIQGTAHENHTVAKTPLISTGSSQSRPSTPYATEAPATSSPPQPNTDHIKLEAFFQYLIQQSPRQSDSILDMEFALCEEAGFSWKVLSRTLRAPETGRVILQPYAKLGLILLMEQQLDKFNKDWPALEAFYYMKM